jgi:hypothetical protein
VVYPSRFPSHLDFERFEKSSTLVSDRETVMDMDHMEARVMDMDHLEVREIVMDMDHIEARKW